MPEHLTCLSPARVRGIAAWSLGTVAVIVGILVPQLFLLAALVVVVVRLVTVMNQRDEAQVELWEERFKNAGLTADRSRVVDVPLYRRGKGV